MSSLIHCTRLYRWSTFMFMFMFMWYLNRVLYGWAITSILVCVCLSILSLSTSTNFSILSWYARILWCVHNCCTPLFSMADLRLTFICVHMYNSITTTDVVRRSEEVHLFKATVQWLLIYVRKHDMLTSHQIFVVRKISHRWAIYLRYYLCWHLDSLGVGMLSSCYTPWIGFQ